ncbi:phosphatidylserine decarboxylase [Flexistipes sinusarabici]|uniref:phosphatidylserine decarboxylase n=1 Tax=Flexistipes sinusarabici TaxID=2352 RepID=UPI002354EE05|nr:phosphatidylserine decarboxylase [Flexistipes sinusarabici]
MIAKEGYPFILTAAAAVLILAIIPEGFLIFLLIVLLAFFIIFFRDPERRIPPFDDIALSGADGKIVDITREEFDGEDFTKISVFMNIFNVHVNRMPLSGKVTDITHKSGKFIPADKKESSFENEQNIITVETKYGKAVFKQVAGLVARRTVCYAEKAMDVPMGDRLGIIKFSSRFDHYLPAGFQPAVAEGEKVKAGETIIARYNG